MGNRLIEIGSYNRVFGLNLDFFGKVYDVNKFLFFYELNYFFMEVLVM